MVEGGTSGVYGCAVQRVFESMRHVTAPLAALTALLAFAVPAACQTYPQDVTVNPSAAGAPVLLYPGGQYGRVVHPLLQPGQDTGPIQLHMPVKRKAARAAHRDTMAQSTASTETTETPPPPKRHRVSHAAVAATPAPQRDAVSPQGTESTLSDFEDLETTGTSKPAAPQPAPPQAAPPPKSVRVAKTEPPPVHTPAPERIEKKATPVLTDYGSKRSTVLFAAGASDPAGSAIDSVKALVADLGDALGDGSTKIQLYAYGGDHGDKSSESRRLSLKRAIVVRQLLIDDGVPSERIDVHAMGGVDDNGPTDRVDIFLKS
jgi:outer membrane protein OmpA-like peptidoglycan-associated protein